MKNVLRNGGDISVLQGFARVRLARTFTTTNSLQEVVQVDAQRLCTPGSDGEPECPLLGYSETNTP